MCLGSSTASDSPMPPERLWRSIPAAVSAALAGNVTLASVTSPCRRCVGVVGSCLGFFGNGVTGAGSGREGEAALAEPSRSWSWGILHPLFPVHSRALTRGGHRGARAPGLPGLCNPMVCSDDAEKFLLPFN